MERLGGQAVPVNQILAGELGGQMLCIGRTAAVAAEPNLAAGAETGLDYRSGPAQFPEQRLVGEDVRNQFAVALQPRFEQCYTVNVVRPSLQNSKS